MPDRSFLNWPFFEPRHREWAEKLDAWCAENLPVDHHDVYAACRKLVDMLGPRRPRIVFSTGSPEDIPPEIAEMGPVFEKPYDPAQLAAALASGAKPGLFARLRNAIS